MKLRIAALGVFATLVALTGCKQSTVEGPAGKKLTLVRPADQTIQRGETNQVAITITRDNFSDPVAVKFDNLPAGVKVVEKDRKINSDQNIVNYTLVADPGADLVKDHSVKVTVEGPNGISTSEVFQLTVKEKS